MTLDKLKSTWRESGVHNDHCYGDVQVGNQEKQKNKKKKKQNQD